MFFLENLFHLHLKACAEIFSKSKINTVISRKIQKQITFFFSRKVSFVIVATELLIPLE